MSKSTQINKRLIAKIPTPGNDTTYLGANSVGTTQIQDGSITPEKLDASASFKNMAMAGFQNFVDPQNVLVATTNTGAPAAGTFHSSIPKRSSIVDITQDLKVNFSAERMMVQQIYKLQDEFGPSSELVYAAVNDTNNLIRFVGSNWSMINNASGQGVSSNNVNDYVEITFYGTGLNVLMYYDGNNNDVRASVNGGAEGSNFIVTGKSPILANRNTSINGVFNVASGLTLGLYTIKLRLNSIVMNFSGFEVLNQSTTLKVNPGSTLSFGKKLTLAAQQSPAYNSGFDSGTLGTKGGRVLCYHNSVGNFGRIVNPVNASVALLNSADHTNEDMVRSYAWREFGAGRTDDFSTLTGSARAAAFTLDDGTTSLVASTVNAYNPGSDLLNPVNANGDFITFTFVGTGLDIEVYDSGAGGSDTYTYQIDGAAAAAWPYTAGIQRTRIQKIVSGLTYGTHTFRINRVTASTWTPAISKFIVYQPKKPTLPVGATELADYNIMGDFVANATVGVDRLTTGILRKNCLKEAIYVNGTGGTTDWSVATNYTNSANCFQLFSDRQNASSYYTFFGTGFDFRFDAGGNRSANISVTLNGLAATTANFPSLVSSVYGTGVAFASGTLDQLDAAGQSGSGLVISGLPLGTYTVRFNNNSAGAFIIHNNLDIITPVHSIKSNNYSDVQMTLPVGSCGISDNRKTTPIKETLIRKKSWSQAVGITSSPTTTSTTLVPCPDMSVVVETKIGEDLEICYRLDNTGNVSNDGTETQIYVDGTPVSQINANIKNVVGGTYLNTDSIIVPVGPGVHKVDLYWKTSANTATAILTRRIIKARAV